MSELLIGFEGALSLTNLAYCAIGCILGTVVGILPGLGAAATMAMLLPLTQYLSPSSMIIMMGGIFYGAQYGGSTTGILINVPGEAASVVSCIDGFQMTKQGRGGEALAIAAIGSFIAGTIGIFLLTVAGPLLANFALHFGAPEFFCIVLFSLTAVLSLAGRSILKGLMAGLVGIVLSCVGLDPLSGKQRFVFNIPQIAGGFDLIPLVMGLFGIAEVLSFTNSGTSSIYQGQQKGVIPRGRELIRGIFASLRGTAVGLALGILPGMTATAGSFVAYDVEKRFSKDPSRFGKGCIEGVAAPESANNAVVQAAYIPLLALGIPTAPIMAILLAAFMMYGVTPGPMLFTQHAKLAWTVIASMYIGNIILVILNLPLVGIFARLALIPYRILGPLVLGICFVGSFSIRNSMFDVLTCILFGMVGYLMKERNWPTAPLILGFILGPMLEQNLRASLGMSGGSILIFFTRPIATPFIGLTVFSVLISVKLLRKLRDEC